MQKAENFYPNNFNLFVMGVVCFRCKNHSYWTASAGFPITVLTQNLWKLWTLSRRVMEV